MRYANGRSNCLTLHRRHLNESQRAMIAARLANLPRGRRETNGSIDLFTTQQQAASLLNVSTPSVERARVVLSEGTPEMIAAVDAGARLVAKRQLMPCWLTVPRMRGREGSDQMLQPATFGPSPACAGAKLGRLRQLMHAG